MSTLEKIVAEYQEMFGEPEYRYFKKYVPWSKPRRGTGHHFVPIGDGEEISQEEFEANTAECERVRTEAFMGRYPRSYWKFDRKMIKEGWREHLIKDIQIWRPTALRPEERGDT